ncbi:DNA gyrase inhibitor GyrI [Paenibacillus sophorae]|uniref:DNA gyrase inhibitor GyrI n=1 Tax=Paenibacillus sophorae TaxID=1333845 RepID=A0A1H8SX39_9BACL|nr:GyrI-like domain-containing protein [Paenibacillus sophorae]QWU15590.1 GyrI-like domain-containing protein [Paenibacillus sophorae]SEO83105.1 DNA gyrase inhibitor GyrI [Paenibacillus sophorae]
MQHIKVETLPNYRIAYVRQVGPYGPANTQAMEKLKKWAKEKNLLTESAIILGIPQDNPETTLPEHCKYDACIVISKDYPMDDSICVSELSEGKYMICKVKHTAEDIQKAWADIIPALQNSGYQMDNKPVLERYTGEMINNDFCEICVPINRNSKTNRDKT